MNIEAFPWTHYRTHLLSPKHLSRQRGRQNGQEALWNEKILLQGVDLEAHAQLNRAHITVVASMHTMLSCQGGRQGIGPQDRRSAGVPLGTTYEVTG